MNLCETDPYFSRKSNLRFEKKARRKKKHNKRNEGHRRYVETLRLNSLKTGIPFKNPPLPRKKWSKTGGYRPKHHITVNFLADKAKRFSPLALPEENGYLALPAYFSFSKDYAGSMFFLKRLYFILRSEKCKNIVIDYGSCLEVDLDASIVMDVILAGFITHFDECGRKGHDVSIDSITPIRFKNEKIAKTLFSIGAHRNLKGLKIDFPEILPFDLRIGDNTRNDRSGIKEIHETEIVDYVIECLKKMNRSLTSTAETNLSKVVGEVIANAEEHSNYRLRYAIGYFEQDKDRQEGTGVFNLVIFNFGQTIYESFKRSDCANKEVVKQMTEISAEYTKKGFFGLGSSEFEEETLWTLYALQEKVTSKKDWKRGNGSIRFIDSFFKLKGDLQRDEISQLTLISGNTKILFDGSYPLIKVSKGKGKKVYEMMTFNDSGDIYEKPNKNFVKFVPQFFPGTLISVKLKISYNNITTIE